MIERSRVRVRVAAEAAGEFSSQGQLFVLTHFGISSTSLLPQQHANDPGHSAKSAGGKLQLNTHAPYVEAWNEVTLETHAWLHSVHRTRAEMAAVTINFSRLCVTAS